MSRPILSLPIPLWLACVLLALPCPPLAAQEAAGAASGARAEAALGVEVTFLANAGFYLESGGDAVLIDSFLRDAVTNYPALPDEVYKQLANAQAPFNKRTLVLVSHEHPDHVQMRGLEKYLSRNAQAELVTSPAVIEALKKDSQGFAAIQERVKPVSTVAGVRETRTSGGASVTFLQLRHEGRDSGEMLNLGHLITLGGLKILHLGDAEAATANFAAYKLASEHVDVAIVPYWFFGSSEAARVLREQIGARSVIACHVPLKLKEKFQEARKKSFPDVILFETCLEKRTFLPAEADGGPGR